LGILHVTRGINNQPKVKELTFASLDDRIKKEAKRSEYVMSNDEQAMMSKIIKDFTLGYLTMYTPRVELDDLCVIDRMQVDQMSFNTYRPNNGTPPIGEPSAWKSNAIRPVVRNKIISICAHATANLIFPMHYAEDDNSDDQYEAAQIMSNLTEYAADQSDYGMYALKRTLTALTDPVSIGYTEYSEVYRDVKRATSTKGVYRHEQMLDPTLSGFQDTVVPCDELFIENFYEPDVQKQAWLIWRRVIGYDLAKAKYGNRPNFQYVSPGVQILYNDANQSFYQVYDTNMRPYDCEEIIYFNKTLDVKIAIVNRVFMDDVDNPNPRNDKLYPFDTFGFELINNRCFYYKSAVNKLGPEADIINTLYPMIIDGTYLNVIPPMIAIGENIVDTSVVVPGVVTTFESPNSSLTPLNTSNNLVAGQNALADVQEKIGETAGDATDLDQSILDNSNPTAYAISRQEAKAATIGGLFIKMIANHVKHYGTLRTGDITQYLTLPDVEKIMDNAPLVYKTFLLRSKKDTGKGRGKKVIFDASIPNEPEYHDTRLKRSIAIKQEEEQKGMSILKTNPVFFRNLKFTTAITPDVLNPMSQELERAYGLEDFDRMVQHPDLFDQEETARLFLMGSPLTRKDPDKFMVKKDMMTQLGSGVNPLQSMMGNGPQQMPPQINEPQPQQAQQTPVGAAKKSPLPQQMPQTTLQ
jgi:hypothetical protein